MAELGNTVERFRRYAECASESHNEKSFCECIEKDFEKMGIPFTRQYLGDNVVTNGWNIMARIPGKKTQPFLIVLHLDTLAPSSHVKTCIKDGKIQSDGNSVLGADGKLAIAVILETISYRLAHGGLNRSIELLFTVGQELGLHGAKNADYTQIESTEAIVPDHYVTGEVLLKTPARHFIHVELLGREAHVIRNEEPGINALTAAAELIHLLPSGKIGENLSVNLFDLISLSASNAVPKYARFDIEVRSFGEKTWEQIYRQILDAVRKTEIKTGVECKLELENDVTEADFLQNTDLFDRLREIYRRSGIMMKEVNSFGLMDASCTNQIGIRTVPIGFSIYHSHSTREYVKVEEIEKMLILSDNLLQYF